MSSNQGPLRAMRSPAAGSSSSTAANTQRHPSQKQELSSGNSSGFTSAMRDRQGRGKDPYVKERHLHGDEVEYDYELLDEDEMDLDDDDDEEMDADGRLRLRIGDVPKNESFEERERRQFALSVLDSPEQLMMYAQSTNDSIPGQRYRFMSTLCGFEEDEPRPQQQQGRVRRRQ